MQTLDIQLVNEVAYRLNMESAFVEKDWYSVMLLQVVADLDLGNVNIAFSGGTCLSKAHKVIHRFSEDMDFIVYSAKSLNRNKLSKVKNQIRESVESVFSAIPNENILARNGNQFFQYNIPYDKHFTHNALRPNLKLEFSYDTPILPVEIKQVRSFMNEYIEKTDSVKIATVSPVEIAGNKLSALSWRVLANNKTEPMIIRHLQDLAHLQDVIVNNQNDFNLVFANRIHTDKEKRGNLNLRKMLVNQILDKLLDTIDSTQYKQDYKDYATDMNYDSNQIKFDDAINRLKSVVSMVQKSDLSKYT